MKMSLPNGIRLRRVRRQRGQMLIMVSLSLLAMCGMMGLAVDLGWSYFTKKSAQAAADAAALAAAESAFAIVGVRSPYVCGVGLTCQPTPASCASVPASPPGSNLEAGCLYAKVNGFTTGGNSGRQNVVIAADITSPPPTAPGVSVYYWTTVRVAESIPQLFSTILGNSAGLTSARATAGIADSVATGSLFTLNRQNDPNPSGAGVDIYTQGGGTIDAGGGVWMASTANGSNGTYTAGHAGGSATVLGGAFINIRGGGTVDNPGNFIPTPQNGFADLNVYGFKDPMRGMGQPPAPPSGLPEIPVAGGTINGDCNNPTVLVPGRYFATGPASKKDPTIVATGQPISFTGCVTLSSGSGGFGNYVFFGGAAFPSTQTTITFQPGRYVYAGALSGNPVFSMHNGVTLQDNTPLDGMGKSQTNSDAGELFVFTDTNYPGLEVPGLVQGITNNLQYGIVDIQMGNTDASTVNLHGLNKFSAALPADLKPFAPSVFWQDQQNSQVVYDANGNVDTSCGSLDSPCTRTSSRLAPGMMMQAHPNLHLYGLVYQPRGAWMEFQGHGSMETPMQLVTGTLRTQGGPTVTMHQLTNPMVRRIVTLLE